MLKLLLDDFRCLNEEKDYNQSGKLVNVTGSKGGSLLLWFLVVYILGLFTAF